jgi:hypothetical protein
MLRWPPNWTGVAVCSCGQSKEVAQANSQYALPVYMVRLYHAQPLADFADVSSDFQAKTWSLASAPEHVVRTLRHIIKPFGRVGRWTNDIPGTSASRRHGIPGRSKFSGIDIGIRGCISLNETFRVTRQLLCPFRDKS